MIHPADPATQANLVLAGLKKKKLEPKKEESEDDSGNPTDFETRFGVLPPWGGPSTGASTPYDHKPQKVSDD